MTQTESNMTLIVGGTGKTSRRVARRLTALGVWALEMAEAARAVPR